MSSLTGPDAPILRLSQGATELAVVADRVKLFSVAQQRLSADATQALSKGSTGDVYTCATWGSQVQSARLLLVGTQAGEVRCYDAARAELRWTAASAVDGGVAGLSCAPDEGTAIAVGRTGGAAVLDLASGKVTKKFQASKHQLSRVALLPGHLALVAGSGVQLFDAAAGARLHKFTGHANPVAAVAATPDGAFICTAAEGERHVAVWNAKPSKSGKRKHKSAAAQLALDQPAVQLEVVPAGGEEGAFHVAALTQAGGVWLFECSPGGAGGAVESRLWGRSAAGGGAVLALGAEGGDASSVNLVLVTGSSAQPAFQRLLVEKPAKAGEVAEFEVAAAQPGGLVGSQKTPGGGEAKPGKGAAKERQAPVAVVDAGAGAVLASKVAGAKRGAEEALEEEAAPMEEGEEGDDDEEEAAAAAEGPTFAERLAALQLQEGPGGGAAAGGPAGAKRSGAAAPPAGPLKADSLSVLLSQALQSGDRALLERCLTVRNEDVIRKTVARLSSADAALFLRGAVQRLQSAPARGEQLAAWIRAVLLAHAGALVAMGGMQETLSYLYQLIEARLASYQSLLSLAGRLDVVLAHAERASAAAAYTAGHAPLDAPLVVVEVGSDDAIEVEDAYAAANGLGSDEDGEGSEWEEDDGGSGSEGGEGLEGLGDEDEEDLEGEESEED